MATVRIAETVAELVRGILNDGGATVDATMPGRPTPTTGYAVSLAGQESMLTLDSADWPLVLADYVAGHRAWLAVPGHYAGAWRETENTVCLDITRIIADRTEAVRVGRSNAQRAIFDIAAGAVVPLEPVGSET